MTATQPAKSTEHHAGRKYQVFISSTFGDLADQRRMVVDVVVDQGHLPIALERFPAADNTVPSVIEKAIGASQIYIVLVGHRYGAVVPGGKISYTQLEYERAVDHAKAIIVPFLLCEQEFEVKRRELRQQLEADKNRLATFSGTPEERTLLRKRISETTSELACDRQLRSFRQRVAKNRFCKMFSLRANGHAFHSHQLFNEYMVLRALIEAEAVAVERRVTGWIREPEELELVKTFQAVSKNKFLVDIVGAMTQFEALESRVEADALEKRVGAAFFADHYLKSLVDQGYGLFFESGSTVAYVAQVVGERLKEKKEAIPLSTNNVLAYLILWLVYRIRCSLFPWGPPETRYGAVFGPLNDQVDEYRTPCFPPQALTKQDNKAIKELLADPRSPAKLKGHTLLLGALSGLQLDLTAAGFQCLGPHVGSIRNRLFKRFMYQAGKPIMLFLTSAKINSPVDRDHCHFVLDNSAWRDFLQNQPVAFCVGTRNDEGLGRQILQFERLGLHVLTQSHQRPHTAFVARNQLFIDQVEAGLEMSVP